MGRGKGNPTGWRDIVGACDGADATSLNWFGWYSLLQKSEELLVQLLEQPRYWTTNEQATLPHPEMRGKVDLTWILAFIGPPHSCPGLFFRPRMKGGKSYNWMIASLGLRREKERCLDEKRRVLPIEESKEDFENKEPSGPWEHEGGRYPLLTDRKHLSFVPPDRTR